ncbi:hypothetical protein F444_18156 [Phytophthora nicotianae P1976]|uniref:Uncharacterized protein n=1 Tax=Phytophthora nicotianae P1976 TaxID=1317066 RepID=A0A080ZCA2_PHYNI|nr:hypothetical protein F444_18156 [Phytophthora nicotianae P1976]
MSNSNTRLCRHLTIRFPEMLTIPTSEYRNLEMSIHTRPDDGLRSPAGVITLVSSANAAPASPRLRPKLAVTSAGPNESASPAASVALSPTSTSVSATESDAASLPATKVSSSPTTTTTPGVCLRRPSFCIDTGILGRRCGDPRPWTP